MPGITFQKCYVMDGKTYPTLDEAKIAAIEALVVKESPNEKVVFEPSDIVAHAVAIIDILTLTAKSKPMARKSNGGTKKRTPKAPEVGHPTPAEAQADAASDASERMAATKMADAANRPF